MPLRPPPSVLSALDFDLDTQGNVCSRTKQLAEGDTECEEINRSREGPRIDAN